MDEALRRAGGVASTSPAVTPSAAPQPGVFVAPWNFGPDGAVSTVDQPLPPTPVVTPIARETPAAESRSILVDSVAPIVARAFDPEWQPRLVVGPQADPIVVEQFRGLAALLHRARAESELKILMVTSADPSEGKSTTSLNLALTLSESYRQRVLLIDADLRKPSLQSITQIASGPGLSECLKARTEQKLAVVAVTPTLTLLPAGRPDPDPMSSLTSERMQRILTEAGTRFEWVILDAPPIGPVADAGLLGAMVDAALLVVRANKTACGSVQKAIESIGRGRILGVVLNGVAEIDESSTYQYYGSRS